MYNFLGIIFQIEKSWCNVRVGIFAFPTLVDFAGKTLMLHLCMQASFLKDMQNSGILLESFRQNMNAIYKILREVACNLKNYKNFPESCKFLQKLKTMLFFPAGFIYKNELLHPWLFMEYFSRKRNAFLRSPFVASESLPYHVADVIQFWQNMIFYCLLHKIGYTLTVFQKLEKFEMTLMMKCFCTG